MYYYPIVECYIHACLELIDYATRNTIIKYEYESLV